MADNTIRTSAPGKILWLGGYSILEQGNTAFVQSVDARVHAEIRESGHIQINLPQFGVKTVAEWKNSTLALKNDAPEANFAKNAIAASLEYLETQSIAVRPFALSTQSDAAFNVGAGKSGLGSSAAATAAMVHGILLHHGVNDLKITHHCAQAAHSRAQGKIGSGFDVAAACFGPIEYQRFSPEFVEGFPKTASAAWDEFVRPLALPPTFHVAFATFPKQSESTVSMIKTVRAWQKDHESEYGALMRKLNGENVNAIAHLEQFGEEGKKEDLEAFQKDFEAGRALTRDLGEKSGAPIEPPDLKALIDQSLENGALVCKSPGAGGKDALAALCLSAKDAATLKAFWEKSGLSVLDVRGGNRGLQTA